MHLKQKNHKKVGSDNKNNIQQKRSSIILQENNKDKDKDDKDKVTEEEEDTKKNLSKSKTESSEEDDNKQSEIYALQERIRKLEADILVILSHTTSTNTMIKQDVSSMVVSEEKKEEVVSPRAAAAIEAAATLGKPPRIVRTDSSVGQFVAYRSFSPSFETNLRQRARGSSIGNEKDNTTVAVGVNDTTPTATVLGKEEDKSDQPGEETDQPLIGVAAAAARLPPEESDPSPHPSSAAALTAAQQAAAAAATAATAATAPATESAKHRGSSVLEYLKVEILGEGQQHPRVSTKVAQETDAVMQDFLYVPMKLEKLLFYGLAICVDSYLYVLTYLPIRVIWSLLLLVCYVLPSNINKTFRFHRRHLYHLQHMAIIVFVYWYVLQPISISMLYHWVRGQNMLKLYVLMAMVEIFDRLMCSFGQDALDSLYWNTTSRPTHLRTFIATLVVIGYASAHSFILFVHVATLNVAMNSADNALLTVLMSNNFAEIKSTVFKKYNKQNLFKITTSDVCERFKLTLFLSLIVLLNYSQGGFTKQMFWNYVYQCGMVFSAELLADWIKHCFITKFNFIKSGVYEDYALILAGDVTGIGHEMWNIDHTHAVIKRVGLSQIPCACVMIRFLREAMRYWSLNQEICVVWGRSFIELFALLFAIKIVLGFIIAKVSRDIIANAPPEAYVTVENITNESGTKKKQAVV